jgi:hypothetical protein
MYFICLNIDVILMLGAAKDHLLENVPQFIKQQCGHYSKNNNFE